MYICVFIKVTTPTYIYTNVHTLSLHAALPIPVITIRTVLSANAADTLTEPGLASRRSMATGTVGASALAITVVAPNSPREMAKAKPAATRSEEQTFGTTVTNEHHVCSRQLDKKTKQNNNKYISITL